MNKETESMQNTLSNKDSTYQLVFLQLEQCRQAQNHQQAQE